MGLTQSTPSRIVLVPPYQVRPSVSPPPAPNQPGPVTEFRSIPTTSSVISSEDTSSSSVSTPSENIESENLRCVICYSDPQTPSICPKCSKLFCHYCISQWLSNPLNSTCPNCRQTISLNQLVTIRWFDDVKVLQKMSSYSSSTPLSSRDNNTDVPSIPEGEDVCRAHSKYYELFCIDCGICLCTSCMDHSIHESHVFQKLTTVCRSKTTSLLDGMCKVREYVAKLTDLESSMQDNLNEMQQQRDEVVKRLQDIINIEIARIDEIHSAKKSVVSTKRNEVARTMNTINRSIREDEANIWDCSKTEFLRRYSSTIKKYEDFLAVPLPTFEKQIINIESNYLSSPKSYFISVKVTDIHFGTKMYVFTDDMDFKWKLSIGIYKSEVLHFAYEVFCLLENGVFGEGYKCRVTLRHPTDAQKNFITETPNAKAEKGEEIKVLHARIRPLQSLGFFANGKIDLEFSVEPVNLVTCLKLWNNTLVKNSKTDQENLNKMIKENKELKLKLAPAPIPATLKPIVSEYVAEITLNKSTIDRTKWVSNQIDDYSKYAWQLELKLDSQCNRIKYFLFLLKGNENSPYQISIAHPPGQRAKFITYNFNSPLPGASKFVEIIPVKGLGFSILKMDRINLVVKIKPKIK